MARTGPENEPLPLLGLPDAAEKVASLTGIRQRRRIR
jgi:hypothetical protein